MFSKIFRLPRRHRKAYIKYKEQARVLVLARLAHYNQHYKFKIGQVRIKNTKSRWGSCSKRGNLNFSYRLALLPPHLCDYVVVHELCHLGEFNHSSAFWRLVAQTIPDFAACRRGLKKLG